LHGVVPLAQCTSLASMRRPESAGTSVVAHAASAMASTSKSKVKSKRNARREGLIGTIVDGMAHVVVSDPPLSCA
jgi:hypothetical protein